MTTTTKRITDIHSTEDQHDGVPILAPGIYGLMGGALLARPSSVAWLEDQGYVSIDSEEGVCAFTEAGGTWLEDQSDESMDRYFYRPTDDYGTSGTLAALLGLSDDPDIAVV